MVVIVPKDMSVDVINNLIDLGETAWLIGEVIKSTGEQVII